jgi:hypothetical protein
MQSIAHACAIAGLLRRPDFDHRVLSPFLGIFDQKVFKDLKPDSCWEVHQRTTRYHINGRSAKKEGIKETSTNNMNDAEDRFLGLIWKSRKEKYKAS